MRLLLELSLSVLLLNASQGFIASECSSSNAQTTRSRGCLVHQPAGLSSHSRPRLITISNRYKTTRTSRVLSRLGAGGIKSDPFEDGEWKVGDVYEDLNVLEQAIILSNAEQDLKRQERLEVLDHMAKARCPLFPDVQKFVIAPLMGALVLRTLNGYSTTTRMILKLLTLFMDVQFWTVVVSLPFALLVMKRIFSGPPEPMPDELKNVDPKYRKYVETDWKSPEASCRDSVLFLLEHWTFAVAGMGIAGVIRLSRRIPTQYPGVQMWWAISQLITRIGVVAALYQYPNQMFQLQRLKAPRPMGLFPTMMQKVVRGMLALVPLGITTDLTKVVGVLGRESLVSFYSSISALLLATWIRMQDKEILSFSKLRKASFLARVRDTFAIVLFWRKPLRNVERQLVVNLTTRPVAPEKKQSFKVIRHFLPSILFLTPIAIPLYHICAITRQFRIVYTHDLSLSLKTKSFGSLLKNDAEMEKRMMWRYRLEWRQEDKRLGMTLREWRKGFWYWVFIEGSVEEKLEKEKQEYYKQEAMQSSSVLVKTFQDLQGTPANTPKFNRDHLKRDAMKSLAEQHQSDYDNNSYEDPLGVAVHQTLGIGLGFQFDHMRPLEKGEVPSLRRLQARAAKSAIKRVQQLYNIQERNKKLEKFSNPEEREKKAEELREMTRTEIKYIGNRLSDLVPTGPSSEFEEFTMQEFRQTASYRRTGSHEMLMTSPSPATGLSNSLTDLLSDTRDQSDDGSSTENIFTNEDATGHDGDDSNKNAGRTNPVEENTSPNEAETAKSTNVTSSYEVVLDDDDNGGEGADEFVEAYLRQESGADDENDDSDSPNIMLA